VTFYWAAAGFWSTFGCKGGISGDQVRPETDAANGGETEGDDDSSGVITRKDSHEAGERIKLRKLFNKADRNDQGSLTLSQFTSTVLQHGAELGHLWSPKEIQAAFRRAKSEGSKWMQNGGSRINFQGFVAVIAYHKSTHRNKHRRLSAARGLQLARMRSFEQVVSTVKAKNKLKRGSHGKGNKQQQGKKNEHNSDDELSYVDKWVSTLVTLLYLLYPMLCQATFALVGCHFVGEGGESYVQMDMQVPCWDWEDMEHLHHVFLLWIPAMFVYVLGLPLMAYAMLRRAHMHNKTERHVKFRFNTLLVGYRSNRYYWEVVVSFRKAAVVGTSVFLVQAGPRWQTLVAQAMTGVLLFMHVAYRPFVRINTKHDTLHNADLFALLTAFVTMSSGIYLFQTSGDGGGFQVFLQIVVVTANVVYMALGIWWWWILKLIDLGNSLEHEDNKNHACMARSVLCLQKILPDWRDQTVDEEIRQSEEAELKAMGRTNLAELLKAKRVAHNWLLKAKAGKIKREAMSVQEAFAENQKKKSEVLKTRQQVAHARLLQRQTARHIKVQRGRSKVSAMITIGGALQAKKGSSFSSTTAAGLNTPPAAATKGPAPDGARLPEGAKILMVPTKVSLQGLGLHLQPPRKKGTGSQYCWAADIEFDGRAAKAGVRDGDLLAMVNGQSAQLNSAQKVVKLLQTASRPMKLVFVHRNNVDRFREEHFHGS
jgi:hypothetical protein